MSSQNAPQDGAQWDGPEPDESPVWSPPETVEGGWRPAPASEPVNPEPANTRRNTRTRVVVTVAALVATVGAVIGGVVLTSGNGGGKPSTNAAGANPNTVVDPPPSGSSGELSGAGSPSVLPTLSMPPAPPTPDQAQALASAQAAEKAFAPPSSVPANVPGYSGSAPLAEVVLPPFLTVTVPLVQAKDSKAQALADQFSLLLKAWAEAWTSGNTFDPRYRTLCVEQCKAVLDPTVTLWKNADILPAGTLRLFNLAGGLAQGDDQSAEAGVCVDDSALTAFRDGTTYQNPYPLGRPELLVFGLVYDKAVGHWVATEAYASPGDSYCAQDTGSSS